LCSGGFIFIALTLKKVYSLAMTLVQLTWATLSFGALIGGLSFIDDRRQQKPPKSEWFFTFGLPFIGVLVVSLFLWFSPLLSWVCVPAEAVAKTIDTKDTSFGTFLISTLTLVLAVGTGIATFFIGRIAECGLSFCQMLGSEISD